MQKVSKFPEIPNLSLKEFNIIKEEKVIVEILISKNAKKIERFDSLESMESIINRQNEEAKYETDS